MILRANDEDAGEILDNEELKETYDDLKTRIRSMPSLPEMTLLMMPLERIRPSRPGTFSG